MTKIVFFGDPDSTEDAEAIYSALIKEANVDLFVNGGDNGYNKKFDESKKIIDKHFPEGSPQRKKLRIIMGNHDTEESEGPKAEPFYGAMFPDLYKEQTGFTEGDSSWENPKWLWSEHLNNEIYFIGMNSQDEDIGFKRNQYNWVSSEINKAKELRKQNKARWILATVHKPWVTKKSSHSAYTNHREVYGDLFYNVVNAMFYGHNHNDHIFRSWKPINKEGNSAIEVVEKLLADGKTIDHSQEHGMTGNIGGQSGHEHNKFKENMNVPEIIWSNDSIFSYIVVETKDKLLNIAYKDKDQKILFDYNISDTTDYSNGTVDPPEPCLPNQHRDPVTGKCVDNPVDPDPTTGIVCPIGWHPEPALGHCLPDLNPRPGEPVCPTGYKWNKTKKVCEWTGTTEPPKCKDNEHWDPVQKKCVPNDPTDPEPCKENECKDPTTNKCRSIGANEQKNPTTGLCETKPIDPDPDGEIDANGMKLLHKITGKTVDMEKGSDHRNGQRYNCNHKFLNYMVQGYFKLGKGQEKIEHKTDGPNHGGCTKLPICMWYELGYEIATGRSELQYEAPHPENHDIPDSALDLQIEVKVKPESWIGYMIAIWDSAEGRRMEQWIDPDPFDTAGKPKNGWIKTMQATEKGQLMPKEYFPRNLVDLIPKFENGFESEIRMHQGTNHDTEMKWVKVYEIVPPN